MYERRGEADSLIGCDQILCPAPPRPAAGCGQPVALKRPNEIILNKVLVLVLVHGRSAVLSTIDFLIPIHILLVGEINSTPS